MAVRLDHGRIRVHRVRHECSVATAHKAFATTKAAAATASSAATASAAEPSTTTSATHAAAAANRLVDDHEWRGVGLFRG